METIATYTNEYGEALELYRDDAGMVRLKGDDLDDFMCVSFPPVYSGTILSWRAMAWLSEAMVAEENKRLDSSA